MDNCAATERLNIMCLIGEAFTPFENFPDIIVYKSNKRGSNGNELYGIVDGTNRVIKCDTIIYNTIAVVDNILSFSGIDNGTFIFRIDTVKIGKNSKVSRLVQVYKNKSRYSLINVTDEVIMCEEYSLFYDLSSKHGIFMLSKNGRRYSNKTYRNIVRTTTFEGFIGIQYRTFGYPENGIKSEQFFDIISKDGKILEESIIWTDSYVERYGVSESRLSNCRVIDGSISEIQRRNFR